ncbi:MAG: quinolinate synthase NadA [Pseudomonadota bacterium]
MDADRKRILKVKDALGDRLVILAHHYQRLEVTDLAHFKGDSFELARAAAARPEATRIVFCGVRFMAEAARILAGPGQRVFMPDPYAGCPMAEMVDRREMEAALARLHQVGDGKTVIPVTYMNSSAETKAFCGENGGIVCTSSNAAQTFRWAFEHGERILFVPDEFLGRNTAAAIGVPAHEVAVYNPYAPAGRLTDDEVRGAKVIVWKGYCHVHTWFTPAHVAAARGAHPGARIVVHPECPPPVVAAADAAGSTRFIVDVVREAGPGAVVVIGTEINLVRRLARDFPDRRVLPLSTSLCPNMYKTTLPKLAAVLEGFEDEYEILLPQEIMAQARVALERMLALP